MRVLFSVLFLCSLLSVFPCFCLFSPHAPELSFSHISFAFPDSESSDFYERHEIWRNVLPAGIKYHPKSDSLFISTPRWSKNLTPPHREHGNFTYEYSLSVPATLAKLDVKSGLLHPYPDWKHNEEGVSGALQSVLGFEIDAYDRLWVLDQGRLYWAPIRHEICSAKLIIFNLTNNEVIKQHCFNEKVAPSETSFLNDLVVDTGRNVAYISDSGIGPGAPPVQQTHGQLIIYNHYDDSSRAILRNHYSTQMDPGFIFYINGTYTVTSTGADGIALTPDGNWLLWCPLSSRQLYSIDTEDLLDLSNTEDDFESALSKVMTKPGPSDGLFSTDFSHPWPKNVSYNIFEFFMSDIENSAVWRVRIPFNSEEGAAPESEINLHPLVENVDLSQWPDTLASDWNRHLYWMANSLSRWSAGQLDWSQKNFFIWKVEIGSGPYLANMPLFTGDSESYEPGDGPDNGPDAPEVSGWRLGMVIVVSLIVFFGLVFCIKKVREGANKELLDDQRMKLLNGNDIGSNQ
jgi:sugar lactone lactonase YvrE